MINTLYFKLKQNIGLNNKHWMYLYKQYIILLSHLTDVYAVFFL